VIPAAGYARRLGALPVSKEVFPLGTETAADGTARVRVPADAVLRAFREAGASRACVVLRNGKWDIPAYLGGGEEYDLALAYLVTPPTPGVPFTIDRALPFIADAIVLFGFPDVVFEPRDAFVQLRRRLNDTGAELVLGLFPARDPSKVDMVDLDPQGAIRSLVIKPEQTTLRYTWLLAAWTPTFTRFLHTYVRRRRGHAPLDDGEVHFGDVIEAAIEAGLAVTTAVVDDASYTDVGTLDALDSVRRHTSPQGSTVAPRVDE
jgi:glucose-1-phosphate thymidylyltransferase